MIKDHADTDPSGFLKVDISEFPEPASPHEDTDPAAAERLGLYRRTVLLAYLSPSFLVSISCWMGPVYALLTVPYIHSERISFWLGLVCALLAVPYIHSERISFWLGLVCALPAVPYIHTERIPFWLEPIWALLPEASIGYDCFSL